MRAHEKILAGGAISLMLLTPAPLWASPLETNQISPPNNTQQLVHAAEHAVDAAWAAYHRTALGGTVASPALQADIEEQLHHARELIIEAQEAASQGDTRHVKQLLQQIKVHTAKALQESKVEKK